MTQFSVNRDTQTETISPMEKPELQIKRVILEKKKEEYKKEELGKLSEDMIKEIEPDYEIYTDGSTSENQVGGGAGIFIQNKQGDTVAEIAKPAGALASSYDTECVAMVEALKWIDTTSGLIDGPLTENHQQDHVAIFTDSFSLVQALESNNWRDHHEWLARIKRRLIDSPKRITVCWIPSHCDTHGNEQADRLANMGTKMDQEQAPVTFSIIKAKIRAKKWTITHKRAKKTYGEKRFPARVQKRL
jgi:ribonuclease HI